jgi:thioredoxin 1
LTEVTDETFADVVLGADVPVLVDFYADWCQPCRLLSPTVEKIAAEFAGRALVVKLNTESSPQRTDDLNVSALPTLILFDSGVEKWRKSGLTKEADLRTVLENFLF